VLVKITLGGMAKFRQALDAGLAGASGPVDDMFKQWASRYLGYTRRRFAENSRGGGDWPPLAPSTVLARAYRQTRAYRRAHGGRVRATKEWWKLPRWRTAKIGRGVMAQIVAISPSILRDTGILFNALGEGAPGCLVRRRPNGIEVGIAGPAPHSTPNNKSRATIAQIAMYHDQGMGNYPRRRIIWPPDEQTRAGMRVDAKRCLQLLARAAGMRYAAAGGGAGAGGGGGT